MCNNYIVTNFGFIKNVVFNRKTLTNDIEYTDKLRYAKTFKIKGAKALMEKHDIIGFIYNPYEEEPVRNLYEVKKRQSWSVLENHTEVVEEWQVVKAFMINESDVNFLQARKLNSRDLMTLEQAQAKAIELNTAMLKELNEKINRQMHEALQQPIDEKRTAYSDAQNKAVDFLESNYEKITITAKQGIGKYHNDELTLDIEKE